MLSIDFKVRETLPSEKSADIVRHGRHLTIYRKSRERKIASIPALCGGPLFTHSGVNDAEKNIFTDNENVLNVFTYFTTLITCKKSLVYLSTIQRLS